MANAPDGSIYVAYADGVARFTRGADGRLVPGGCVANGGAGGCVDPVHDSLGSSSAVAVTSDGSSIYVAGGAAVSHLSRNPDGTLAYVDCAGPAVFGCGVVSPALTNVSDLAISPNDKNLYVTSDVAGSSFVLDIGPGGALLPKPGGSFCLNDGGTAGCASDSTGSLAGARAVLVSPEGSRVYVASRGATPSRPSPPTSQGRSRHSPASEPATHRARTPATARSAAPGGWP